MTTKNIMPTPRLYHLDYFDKELGWIPYSGGPHKPALQRTAKEIKKRYGWKTRIVVAPDWRKNPMKGDRYFLYDVLSDYSLSLVPGQSEYATLARAKKRAVTDNKGRNVIWHGDTKMHGGKAWRGFNTFDELINLISTEKLRGRNPKLRQKKATTVKKSNGIVVRLYDTDIVKILPNGDIKLDSGGFMTATTKRRMNEAAKEFELYFNVFQKKGKWYVSTEDRLEPPKTVEFFDGIVIPGPQHLKANPKRRKKVARKKRRSPAQIAATKKLVALNKKKRGKKRRKKNQLPLPKIRRKKRKVAKRKTVRKTAAKTYFVFRCTGKVVTYLKVWSPKQIFSSKGWWTTDRKKALLWPSQKYAASVAKRVQRPYASGAARSDTTKAQIIAACSKA